MNITMEQLGRFIESAVDAGVQSYIRSIEPHNDQINQTDAKRYIVALGFKQAMLRKWTDAGLLHRTKTGDAANSAAWYSKAEIKKVVAAAKLKMLV